MGYTKVYTERQSGLMEFDFTQCIILSCSRRIDLTTFNTSMASFSDAIFAYNNNHSENSIHSRQIQNY